MNYDIESVTNWDALCRVAHGMARDKGWWEEERPVHRLRLLIASELAEAVECLRDNKIETWHQPSGKPEGFWVEIADALIRLADAVGGGVMECGCVETMWETDGDMWELLDAMMYYLMLDKTDDAISDAFGLALHYQHDLWATIREKLRYNATRPHKHGRGA